MITLTKEEIYEVIRVKLKPHYQDFHDDPEINLCLNVKNADYNRILKRLEFRSHIVTFQYENDFPRKLTVKEIEKMIREEYSCFEARINLYLDTTNKCTNYEEEAILEAAIDYGGDTALVEAQLEELINLALSIGDEEWFTRLSSKFKRIKIHRMKSD